MGIRNKNTKPKVNKNINPEISSPEVVSFSFQYLTTKDNFNFENMVKGDRKVWLSALAERMMEISKTTWIHWNKIGRKHGTETIPAVSIRFQPNGYTFSKDEKVIIFRFNSQKGRIIGVKKNDSPTFYVIGLETDFSAYDHGS